MEGKQDVDKLNTELDCNEDIIEQLKRSIEHLHSEAGKDKQQIEDLQQKTSFMHEKLTYAQKSIESKENAIKKLAEEHDQLRETHSEVIELRRGEKREYEETIKDLKSNVQKVQNAATLIQENEIKNKMAVLKKAEERQDELLHDLEQKDNIIASLREALHKERKSVVVVTEQGGGGRGGGGEETDHCAHGEAKSKTKGQQQEQEQKEQEEEEEEEEEEEDDATTKGKKMAMMVQQQQQQQELQIIQEKLREKQRAWDLLKDELTGEIQRQKEQFEKKIEQTNAAHITSSEELKSNLKISTANVTSLETQLVEMKAKLLDSQNKLTNLTEDLERLQKKNEGSQAQNGGESPLSRQLAKAKSELMNAKKEISSQKSVVHKYVTVLKQASGKLADAKKENKIVNEKRKEAERKLSILEKKFADYIEKNSSSQAAAMLIQHAYEERNEERKARKELEEKYEKLNKDVNDMQIFITHLNTEKIKAENRVIVLQRELKRANITSSLRSPMSPGSEGGRSPTSGTAAATLGTPSSTVSSPRGEGQENTRSVEELTREKHRLKQLLGKYVSCIKVLNAKLQTEEKEKTRYKNLYEGKT
eukprot:jgi/Bigna1/142616/aug1.71_g17324